MSALVMHMYDFIIGDYIDGEPLEPEEEEWVLACLRLHDMGIVAQLGEFKTVHHYWRYLSSKRYAYLAGEIILP